MDLAEKLNAENILSEFENEKENFQKIKKIAISAINAELENEKNRTLGVFARVKEKESLKGKLSRKSGKYHSLSDITDILGVRIITYFADDVDKIGSFIEKLFEIDWENSIDKRKNIAATEFGYISLHYICSLKNEGNENDGKSLKNLKFEIQIRTGLQHIWAEIEHDIGYKSKFGIPREIRRQFSKVASLLEIADDEFLVIRDGMIGYVSDVREKIRTGKTENIAINTITLDEYMKESEKMSDFLSKISAIDGAEITFTSHENYVSQLDELGKKTLFDIDEMIEKRGEEALKIAEKSLKGLELDILASTVGLFYLCKAEKSV